MMQHINFIHIILFLLAQNVKNNGFYYIDLILKVHSITKCLTFEIFTLVFLHKLNQS